MAHIFESGNVVVRRVEAARLDRWVVTFDNHGIGHGFDRPGFAESFLQDQGISALHVMGRGEDWYQYPEMGEAMAIVRATVAGADRVLTYGSSMGAYAAIRFADAAGANAVLAVSPQYSVDPKKTPFEHRWARDAGRIRWLSEIDGRIACAIAPIVVYDPVDDDGLHMDLIRNEIAVEEVPVAHIGHPATTVLSEVGLLAPLVLESLDGTVDAQAFTRTIRARRRDSSVYVSLLAEAQPVHRPRTALALARAGLEICPASPISMATLGHVLTTAGEYEEAISLLRTADVLCSGENLHIAARLAFALSGGGRLDEAYAVVSRIASVHPHLVQPRSLRRRVLRAANPGPATSRWRLRAELAMVATQRAWSFVTRSLRG